MDSDTTIVRDGPLWRWLDVPDPSDLSLSDCESVRETWPCNHAENRRIARGGRLFLTNQRIAFRPHSFDARFGATEVDVSLDDVRAVGTESGDSLLRALGRPLDAFLAGGFERRVRVATDQQVFRFIVDDPDAVSHTVETALSAP
ncbi:MAG: hypothetical protein J07HX64_01403 [halophilic archaeon J07HX64]|jgi:GRAM domain.|nr:MAG: hypothetical protein J07HX64_01403 [halophilic archaeon J07HX64]